MFPQPIDPAESNVMAEAIGGTTFSFLGGSEAIDSLTVRYYPREMRGIVWVGLTDPSFESQLRAITLFADVRGCYVGESELELRFGEPVDGQFAEPRAQVFARSA